MAEDFEDKTEPPSEKRRGEARERGDVAKSSEINSVIVLLAGIMMLRLMAPYMFREMAWGTTEFFSSISDVSMSQKRLMDFIVKALIMTFKIILPVVIVIMVAGIAANILQTGFLFTTKPLIPDLNKINPVNGFKRLFSLRALFETLKNIVKLIIISLVAYLAIKVDFVKMLRLSDTSVGVIWVFMLKSGFGILLKISLVLIIIAILDFAYQKYEYEKHLKMSIQEVKEERKEMEGDPKIKSRIRSMQREMARRRMMKQVPKATVVVTNPTTLAIALLYEPSQHDAPIVVAKGKRLIAEKIKEIAKENGIPIIENKPLVRAMYDKVEVGFPIPVEFFTAVAEIMAYVYRLKNKKVG